jgi:cobalt/nickel transport system permease protein
MHVHYLDPYRPRSSPIHAFDARIKLVLTVVFIFANALLPVGAWPVYILMFSLVLAVEILSELGVVYVLKRSILALPFVLAALPLLFTVPGLPLVSFSIGAWDVSISQEGLVRFISITLKSWISLQAAILLASTTTFPDLLMAMRAIKIPRLLVSVFGLMWRYLFVLVDEALRLMRARTARSGHSDQPGLKPGGSLAWRGRVTGGMAGNLFLRGFERGDRIYMAMVSRGYDGEVRALPQPKISGGSWLVLILGLVFISILLGMGLIFWG